MKRAGRIFAFFIAIVMISGIWAERNVQAAGRGYSFTYKKKTVTIDSQATSFLKAAGKASSTKKSKSCAYDGEDITYKYKYFTVYTYSKKKGSTEYISSIRLTSSKVKTPEGVKVGSSVSTMKKKYGKAKEVFGVYTYTKGNTQLQFDVNEDDKITSITYKEK